MIIGLTGPSGSGKSFVLDCWARCGIVPVNADAVYHELLTRSESLQTAILERFGTLDRRLLAKTVFADPQSLKELEAIAHPAVIAAIRKQLSTVDGQLSLALEAIALFESGLDTLCGATVAVTAGDELRLQRLVTRDGRGEAEIRSRMAAGKPASWYAERAGYVLDGGSETLEEDAIKLLDKILCK